MSAKDTMNQGRAERAAGWAAVQLDRQQVTLEPVSEDASFRRYFRVTDVRPSLIVMDAPPDKEDSAPFLDVAERLRNAGLRAPRVLGFDLELGFGLLEDFGDTLYRDVLDEHNVDDLFPGLFDTLGRMATRVETAGLPRYDSLKLQQDLSLFTDWYLRVHKQRPLQPSERLEWNLLCELLIRSANVQPQTFVHRDFHSCNLLQLGSGGPGIIDFQDAVLGPVTYDFVSLIWDRYISWPRTQLETWMSDFHARLRPDCDRAEWIRWCDWMGLQRNLKIVGIFARLFYRDGKRGYLEMIPRFYSYVTDVMGRYPEFEAMHRLVEDTECAP